MRDGKTHKHKNVHSLHECKNILTFYNDKFHHIKQNFFTLQTHSCSFLSFVNFTATFRFTFHMITEIAVIFTFPYKSTINENASHLF